jgi:hypothetical protein
MIIAVSLKSGYFKLNHNFSCLSTPKNEIVLQYIVIIIFILYEPFGLVGFEKINFGLIYAGLMIRSYLNNGDN